MTLLRKSRPRGRGTANAAEAKVRVSSRAPRIGVAEVVARAVARFTASTAAFILAIAVVVVWAVTGPLFGYSNTWQLVINTGTTIVTFLMVFLIQRTQDKESLAVQLKLNELIAALEGASNRMVDVESVSEAELEVLRRHYGVLASMAKAEADIHSSHSVDEAQKRHAKKSR